ncbi:hypothetical protein D2T29_14995 [Sinirhodobacter populi]|uniref:Major capsid protein n=1 Tax=Paenirhodobacter populi TaxID=2306993 RepID=A0A443K910_9RHOB|nr:major capsid protein [Sinirhodobacter populi]RWR29192.1 hypothetical protein D2T29_14995 [Sinirhodobacter populi]
MNALNLQTARVIDPVLTGIAQGYIHAQRVGHILFPTIPVPASGGTVIEFGRESFFNYNSRRAPGAAVVRIQFGYEGKPYALKSFAMDTPIPREFVRDAETVPGIDLGKRAVNTLMNSFTLTLEIEQATLATDPANYGGSNKLALTGSDCWDHEASDPIRDFEDAKEQVRGACGIDPNRAVIGSKVFNVLKRHPKVVERFKYTSAESVTAKMLAGLLDLEELAVGKATYNDETNPAAGFKDARGNVAVLGYVPSQDQAMEQPSFGYTYTLNGHPFVETPRWDGNTRSWVYGITYERAPQLTGIASGFLFQTPISE